MNGKPINNQPGQPQQTYTVWERQCDNEQQLDCPVSVMKKCYPIRVPNCRTVTDIKRRTFQVNKLLLKFSFSEKATKIWKKYPSCFDKSADLLGKRQKKEGDFYKFFSLLTMS